MSGGLLAEHDIQYSPVSFLHTPLQPSVCSLHCEWYSVGIIFYCSLLTSSGRDHNGQERLHHETVSTSISLSLTSCSLSVSLSYTALSSTRHHHRQCYTLMCGRCVSTCNEEFDNTFTLLLQLACVIHMKDKDKMLSYCRIRIFVVVDSSEWHVCFSPSLFCISIRVSSFFQLVVQWSKMCWKTFYERPGSEASMNVLNKSVAPSSCGIIYRHQQAVRHTRASTHDIL